MNLMLWYIVSSQWIIAPQSTFRIPVVPSTGCVVWLVLSGDLYAVLLGMGGHDYLWFAGPGGVMARESGEEVSSTCYWSYTSLLFAQPVSWDLCFFPVWSLCTLCVQRGQKNPSRYRLFSNRLDLFSFKGYCFREGSEVWGEIVKVLEVCS
jgi:hypothetical protein